MHDLLVGTLAVGIPSADGLDRGTALLAIGALVVFALVVNLAVRPYLHRRPRRRRGYGPDDVRRDGAAWNLGVGGPWRGHVRSQLHDRSGSGSDPRDPHGSDAGPDDEERGGRGPLLR